MWLFKYLTQLILSYVPGGERVNYALQVARGSHRPEVAARRLVGLAEVYARLGRLRPIAGSEILEIGTGWDAINPLVLYLLGAKRIHTFDIVRHARAERVMGVTSGARSLVREIAEASGVPVMTLQQRIDRVAGESDLDAVFSRAGIVYHAPADAVRSGLPDSSVDFVISYAVLAHLSVPSLNALVPEMRRVLKPQGVAFHVIGLEDPYGNLTPGSGRVRFLGYPEWVWRILNLNRFNSNNRLREQHYVDLFRHHGAEVIAKRSDPDPIALQELKSLRVGREFRELSPEQLAVCHSEIAVRFGGRG